MTMIVNDYRLTSVRKPKNILTGLDAKIYSLVGKYQNKRKKHLYYLEQASNVLGVQEEIAALNRKALRDKLATYRKAFLRAGDQINVELVHNALAAISEAVYRCLGYRPYRVQLAGALALFDGNIVEMATGEGKTLTAAMCAVMRGWSGRPCHVITVNDYLAMRDARSLSSFYDFCEVSVGHVVSDMKREARKVAYAKDVTYATSKEVVADFLRDRLWLRQNQDADRRHIKVLLHGGASVNRGVVMRGLHTAIVDEADSVLIDEAVTPLIISAAQENRTLIEACLYAHGKAQSLEVGVDYSANEKYKEIDLSSTVVERLREEYRSEPVMHCSASQYLELVRQALTAREFFKLGQQYIIQEGRIVIVDEFTGRPMPQRSWQAGLQQMVEAKEGVDISPPTETVARLSFQNFYRLYHNLSGMTGTAVESADELWHVYDLRTISIPVNVPSRREVSPLAVFESEAAKWQAILTEIKAVHKAGRPILIGTRSVQASEKMAAMLLNHGYRFRLLNATQIENEAEVISEAGQAGVITIATNMAGRGTDIVLGDGVNKRGGLHVIGTESHESARVDRQLVGRCARQGDRGSASFYASIDDELIAKNVPRLVVRLVRYFSKSEKNREIYFGRVLVKIAQSTAQKRAYRRRKSVIKTDTWVRDSLSFAQVGDGSIGL